VGWVYATTLEDLTGPLYFAFNATPPRCLAVVEESHQLYLAPAAGDRTVHHDDDDGAQIVAIRDAEPSEVTQVFVGQRLATGGGYTLRSVEGRYLSADKFGVVSCDKEAIGPTEEWQPVLREDGIAWQSVYGKFLAEAAMSGRGRVRKMSGPRLRADAEAISFSEVFRVKCQAGQNKRKRTASSAHGVSEADVDVEAKRYQSGGSRLRPDEDGERLLKRAKREGQLAQALLDRREKTKADRYCK
ncbi:FRG1-like family-domain-containing protein, partial [Thamnocephalis sphaerospora]